MGDLVATNPLVLVIGACEVGFWVLLGAGLAARYLLRRERLSSVLLLAVPVLDVVLVTASVVDVATGTPPGFSHGLAAAYLGFTVGFGHATIRWVDVRFAHRFAGGPAPVKAPKHGTARMVHEWREWSRVVAAGAVTLVVVALTATVAGTAIPPVAAWSTDALWNWPARIGLIALIWLAVGPMWATLFPSRDPARS